MAKASSVYVCQSCGFEAPKWSGQCPNCAAWNTLEETIQAAKPSKKAFSSGIGSQAAQVVRFSEVNALDRTFIRLTSQMGEFDRVLGGGIVQGSVVLIGGEPGIGKSTLLTHLSINVALHQNGSQGDKVTPKVSAILYIAGEESPEQIAIRMHRLTPPHLDDNSWKDRIIFSTSTDVDEIIATIEAQRPMLAIVDSIQTLATEDLTGSRGSIGQLKECTERLTRAAKRLHIPIFIVGHVTKEGTIAGPKVLEHIVDSVLELSGERTGQFRLLRAIKNRFGPTDEVGIFEVVDEGMKEVTNPSSAFLEERVGNTPGSALVSVVEGTRPIVIEVQALVIRSQLAMPRRVARGIPIPKLQVLCAVLEKYCKLPLSNCDVFVNVAGGFTINEPACDLGVAIACASSFYGVSSPKDTVYIGEVGLLGEIRKVKLFERRVKESKRVGFSHVIGPDDAKWLSQVVAPLKKKEKKIEEK